MSPKIHFTLTFELHNILKMLHNLNSVHPHSYSLSALIDIVIVRVMSCTAWSMHGSQCIYRKRTVRIPAQIAMDSFVMYGMLAPPTE